MSARRTVRALAVALGLACVLAGCGWRSADTSFTPREVAAPTPSDPAAPCVRAGANAGTVPGGAAPGNFGTGAAASGAGVGAAANGTGAARSARTGAVRAALQGGVITVSGGTGITLAALSRAVRNPAALKETAPGEWLLGADLVLLPGASLRVAAPEARWLKLRSEAGRFVTVKALGGGLAVEGTCVTSWDAAAGRADTEHADGRAFLLARDGGELTVDRSELHYLGFGAVESYGLSWRTAGTRGSLTGSLVTHLYFGLYSYELDGLVVRDNEISDNVLYGVDPHTRSRNLVIERNVVHDNGKHGIILAEECTDSVIRDNVVYRNAHHGIVLYQRSDRNVIENNETFLNNAQGINVNESSDNQVRGNRAYRNAEAGIGIGQTGQRNTVENNQVRGNQQDGIRLVSEAAQTTLRGNTIGENTRYGLYIDGNGGFQATGNTIFGSRVGVMLKDTSEDATRPGADNTLRDNAGGDVKVQ